MLYHLYPQTGETRIFKEKYSRSRIPYHTGKSMRAKYPGGGFVIIGEIGNFAQTSEDYDVLLASDGKELPIFPRGSLSKHFEWIAGYVAVGENTYVAAVKSIFPSFLRWRKQRL